MVALVLATSTTKTDRHLSYSLFAVNLISMKTTLMRVKVRCSSECLMFANVSST